MSASNAPRVGVIADNRLGLHQLQNVLYEAGYRIGSSWDTEQGEYDREQIVDSSVDAWVVELNDIDADLIDCLYEQNDIPILVGEGVPETSESEALLAWRKRLMEKLRCLPFNTECVEETVSETNPYIEQARQQAKLADAKHVWVLAASMGGPEAVKEFLDEIPADLPVAFVYAQHIDDDYDDLLKQVLGRDNHLRIRTCADDHHLSHGQVTIVPTDHQVNFAPFGKVENLKDTWPAPFSPDISQVIRDVAKVYKQNSGVIVFSGMSNDGAEGVKALRSYGGKVWAQTPESCICSSMPDAALETGKVALTATPTQLAHALCDLFSEHYVVSTNS